MGCAYQRSDVLDVSRRRLLRLVPSKKPGGFFDTQAMNFAISGCATSASTVE